MSGHITLLSWGFASAALLAVGIALSLSGGPPLRRLAGSTFLKVSALVLAGFGWGALGPGGREPAPSALAAFFVVLMFSLLTWFLEYEFAARLERAEPVTVKTRPAPSAHRAKDYVRRYPEQTEISPGGNPVTMGPPVYGAHPLPKMTRPIEPSTSVLGEDNPPMPRPPVGAP